MIKKILIVDDAKFMRKILSKIVEDIGFKLAGTAKNGKEAIKKYKQLKPDLVTMDITMPEMGGIEAIRHIITYDPEAIIIACSAMGQKQVIMESLDVGAKDFIVKPFKEDKIIKALNSAFEQEKDNKNFNLNLETTGKGVVKNLSGTYKSGEEITLLAKPASGYKLKYWEVNGERKGNQDKYIITMDEDKEVLVVFSSLQYQLNIESYTGEIIINPKKESYYHGEIVTLKLKLNTKQKQSFVGWQEENEIISENNSLQLQMTEDKTIKTVFDQPLNLILPQTDYSISENEILSFTIEADYHNDALVTLSCSNLPENAEFIKQSNNKAQFLWQPTYNQADKYNVFFIARAENKNAVENVNIKVDKVNTFDFHFNPSNYDLVVDNIIAVYLIGEFNNWGKDKQKAFELENCPKLERVDQHWESTVNIDSYKDLNQNGKCDFKWLVCSTNHIVLPEDDNLKVDTSPFTLPNGEGGFHFYLDLEKHYNIDYKKQKIKAVYLITENNNWNKRNKTYLLQSGHKDNIWFASFDDFDSNSNFKWVIEFKQNKLSMYPENSNILLEDEFS